LVPDLNFLGTGGSTASHRSATFEIENNDLKDAHNEQKAND
jgi:hypothetical protein